ncbi:MAG: DUF1559 domain-containing protein [Pirellulales bacterium]
MGNKKFRYTPTQQSGISFQSSTIRFGQIPDGTSNTYCVGERYVNPDNYKNGNDASDDQYITMGHDQDIVRYSFFAPAFSATASNLSALYAEAAPRQDTPGISLAFNFGAPHAAAFNMVFCDGSVHAIPYNIDGETHRRLGTRNDNLPVELP